MSLLELKGISKSFRLKSPSHGSAKQVDAVINVSLNLEKGLCLGVVGESGSGKSTLGRIIAGLEKPDDGELLFNGNSLLKRKARDHKNLRREIQMVFQDCYSSVNPRMAIKDIIAEPIQNYETISSRELSKKIGELLEIVDMNPDDMGKYPHEISGGQLQRVCIARAIALRPQLMILDEAVSSLDVLVQLQILQLLARLKNEFRLSYLFISHDLQAIRLLSDELVVMNQGGIVEKLTDAKALDRLEHPASRKLIDSILPSFRQ